MPVLSLGVNAYKRDLRYGAETKLFNMYLEEDPNNEVDGLARMQRPGLVEWDIPSLGDGAMRGAGIRATGTPEYWLVMGSKLHGGTEQSGIPEIGTIGGSGVTPIAVGASHVVVVGGFTAYHYAVGTGFQTLIMPGSFSVRDVAILNGYTFFARSASNRVYWAEPGETSPDALSFFSAEYDPDTLMAVRAFNEELWIFGNRTIEVWGPTGDADAPMQRIPGRTMTIGALNRDAIVQIGDKLIWPTSDGRVFAWSGGLKEIGHKGITEELRPGSGGGAKAWGYILDGCEMYVLTTGSERTLVCNLAANASWSEFGTVGRDGWQAHLGIQTSLAVIAGDDITNTLWQLDPTVNTDDGETFERLISGRVTVLGKPICNASVELAMPTGFAPSLIDDDELLYRYSDDDGQTWTTWDTESVGATGQYGGILTLRRQGLIEPPGRVYEFKYTADGPFRISYARVGEGAITKPRAA